MALAEENLVTVEGIQFGVVINIVHDKLRSFYLN